MIHRVLHLDSGLTWRGGQRQLLLLAVKQVELGHEVWVACPQAGSLFQRLKALGLNVIPMANRNGFDLMSLRSLKRSIQRLQPNIVHAHTSHVHTLALWAKITEGTQPFALVVHRRIEKVLRTTPWIRWKYAHPQLHFCAVSKAVAQQVKQGGASHVRVVPSAVQRPDLRELSIPQGLFLDREATKIVVVGHLAKHKGHKLIIEALAKVLKTLGGTEAPVPKLRLYIIGAGPCLESLQGLSRSLGLEEEVIFTGFRDDILSCMAQMDLFVMPSLTEGLGTAVLDALHLALPTLVSSAGGLPEAVGGGLYGRIVQAGNVNHWAQALADYLEDPGELLKLAKVGQKSLLSGDSVATMAMSVCQLYDELESSSTLN